MIAYTTKDIKLLYITDENTDGETHFVPERVFNTYVSKRLVTPKLCVICATVEETRSKALRSVI